MISQFVLVESVEAVSTIIILGLWCIVSLSVSNHPRKGENIFDIEDSKNNLNIPFHISNEEPLVHVVICL